MSYDREEENINPQQRVVNRPQFNFNKYPKGTHAKTYSGKVVKLVAHATENSFNIGWAFGRQGKRVAINTDHTGKADNRDDSINPDTVKFSRMKTTDIDLTGVPIGTVFKNNYAFRDYVGYLKVVSTNDTEQADQPIKCVRLKKDENDNLVESEDSGDFMTFTKQGFSYGGSYKTQRSAGDIYYEHIIYPLSDEDHDIANQHVRDRLNRRAKARSIFKR